MTIYFPSDEKMTKNDEKALTIPSDGLIMLFVRIDSSVG